MKLVFDTFYGLMPRIDARKLPELQAQTAQNVDLTSAILEAVAAPSLVHALDADDNITVYPYNDDWLEWTTDVDVAPTMVKNDQYERIYFTGDDHPKVHGISDDVEFEYALGVPKPVIAPTIAAEDVGSVTWTRRATPTGTDGTWGYQYEEPDGSVSQSGTLTEGTYTGANVHEVTTGASYRIHTVPAKTTASASAIFVMFFDAVSASGTQLGRLYPDVSKYTANSDFYLSGAKASAAQVNTTATNPEATFVISYDTSRASDYEVTRSYVYTFVTTHGEEGPPSEPTDDIDITPVQQCVLSALDTGITTYSAAQTYKLGQTVLYSGTYYLANIDIDTAEAFDSTKWDSLGTTVPYSLAYINIYRTQTTDAGTYYFFVTQLDIGTTTYTDTTVDEDLGAEVESIYWYPPKPSLRGLVAMPGAYMAAFDADNKLIYFCEANHPHAWNHNNALLVTDTPVALGVNSTGLVVMTNGVPEMIIGISPDAQSQTSLNVEQACVAKRSATIVREGSNAVIYASPDGLMLIDGLTPTLVTQLFYDREAWQALTPEDIISVVHDGKYYGFSGSTTIIFDPKAGEAALTTTDETAAGLYVDLTTDLLHLIQDDSLNSWNSGDTNLTGTWRSRKWVIPRPDAPVGAKIEAEEYGDGKVTLKLYANEAATPVYTGEVTSGLSFTLPNLRRENVWEVEIVTTVDVTRAIVGPPAVEIKEL